MRMCWLSCEGSAFSAQFRVSASFAFQLLRWLYEKLSRRARLAGVEHCVRESATPESHLAGTRHRRDTPPAYRPMVQYPFRVVGWDPATARWLRPADCLAGHRFGFYLHQAESLRGGHFQPRRRRFG